MRLHSIVYGLLWLWNKQSCLTANSTMRLLLRVAALLFKQAGVRTSQSLQASFPVKIVEARMLMGHIYLVQGQQLSCVSVHATLERLGQLWRFRPVTYFAQNEIPERNQDKQQKQLIVFSS